MFVDTPAAYPGIESEERGIAEAIALNLREMAMLDVPIVVNVCGEGGSGGALGLAIGDRILMHEFAVYSRHSAGRLRRDSLARQRAQSRGCRCPQADRTGSAQARGIIDEIVPEPVGGAHTNPSAAATMLDAALVSALARPRRGTPAERLDARYQKFRRMGRLGQDFADEASSSTHGCAASGSTRRPTTPPSSA